MNKGALDRLLPINTISPIDGRYREKVVRLVNYFSEFTLIKFRAEIELRYLIFLSKERVAPKITKADLAKIDKIIRQFSLKDALRVKKIESKTKHDVKALEYFLREKLSSSLSKKLSPWIHFALTSEDVNNVSYRLAIKEALAKVLVPTLARLNKELAKMSVKYSNIVMLGRTHGQAAVPTTFGKELKVFQKRLVAEVAKLSRIEFRGKFGGAVGNLNAHVFSFPEKTWLKISARFLKTLGLEHNLFTTQIAPPEDMIEIFHCFLRINGILLDLNQDMWRYISDGWVIQKGKTGDIGSSTMPQKINPIEFENSEGNLVVANGLFETFARKLPISRLQRDLSESTVLRNIGVAFAHSLIAYESLLKGLSTIDLNRKKIGEDLNANWAVLSEALQVLLRKEGDASAYEKVASLAKNTVWTKEELLKIIEGTALSSKEKQRLTRLTPIDYIGLATKLARKK